MSNTVEYTKLIQDTFGLLAGYEQTELIHYSELEEKYPSTTYRWEEIPTRKCVGLPYSVYRGSDGKLMVSVMPHTHCLIIGATGSGKTQLLMMILEFIMASESGKRDITPFSFCISDPKNELYNTFGEQLRKTHRLVKMDFVNYAESDRWNILGPIYDLYSEYKNVINKVRLVTVGGRRKNEFFGKIYESKAELDAAIAEKETELISSAEAELEKVAQRICPTVSTKEPTWENGARDIFKAIVYGMLEDKVPKSEFTIDNVMKIFDTFGGDDDDYGRKYDNGYFSNRPKNKSKALALASRYVLINARTTRDGYVSTLSTALNTCRDKSIRYVTGADTFDMEELACDNKPVVIFLTYPDETKLYGKMISLFLSTLYTTLTKKVRENGDKPRATPFYFFLDEFGNLPQFPDFETNISAARARNIWFWIVLQSYAQAENVYGTNVAKIIKDNLNAKIFLGTNDRETAEEFSRECGKYARLSPSSIMSGDSANIPSYSLETLPIITVSKLTSLPIGSCVVKRMNAPVLISHFERHYECPEFSRGEPSETKKKSGKKVDIIPTPESDNLDLPLALAVEKQYKKLLGENSFATIPDLQSLFGLTYKTARDYFSCFVKRGWSSPSGSLTTDKKMVLPTITDKSAKDSAVLLYERNNGKVLIAMKGRVCVSKDDISSLCGELSFAEINYCLSELMDADIISYAGGFYFPNVSDESIDKILKAFDEIEKERNPLWRFDF